MHPSSIKNAILITLRYFDLFDFPMTIDELSEYLYGWSASIDELEKNLPTIAEIETENGFFFLKGKKHLVALRLEKEKHSRCLWKKVFRYRFIFSYVPFVRMVAVVNTLAYGNVKPTSDIDLFIITAKNRLSTARFFMTLLTHIFGMRVHHKKKAGRFCLSFFVSEDSIDMSNIALNFDPHLAYFVLTMKPVTGQKMHKRFCETNKKWLGMYFKGDIFQRGDFIRYSRTGLFVQKCSELIMRLSGAALENKLYRFFHSRDIKRSQQFSTKYGIMLQKNIFKFHEQDPRRNYAETFVKFNKIAVP